MNLASTTEFSRLQAAELNAFDCEHSLYGSPMLRIYAPISEWTLSAGVTYSKTRDRFEDSEGDAVSVNYATQDYTEAAYVPVIAQPNPVLFLAGLLELPGLQVQIKYSAAVETALNSYWAILLGGQLYRQTDRTRRQYQPPGLAAPLFIQLDLQEQVKTYA